MLTALIYICAIVIANLAVAHFGPWFSPINSFVLIGLDLSLRDHLHERWRDGGLWPRMLALISAAGAVSYILNPAAGQIAIASVVAFCTAALVDSIVYQAVARRSFMERANISNTAGALADSLIFPTVAFGALLPQIVAMQFAAKLFGGAIWALLIWRLTVKRSA